MSDFVFDIDKKILLFIQDYIRQGWLTPIVKFITHLGDAGILWIALTLLFLLIRKYRKTGAMMSVALVIGLIITNLILKNSVARIRPYVLIDSLKLLIEKQKDFSFPSGHSTSSIAASVVMFRTLPKKIGIPALILGLLICLSRLYVGVHYPSDVVAGIIIGVVAAHLAIMIINKILERIKKADKTKA